MVTYAFAMVAILNFQLKLNNKNILKAFNDYITV